MQKLRFLIPAIMLCAVSALAQPSKPLPRGVTASDTPESKLASGPTYKETVDFLIDKLQQAGIPGNTDHGRHGATYVRDDAKYSINVESCDSITITTSTASHVDDPNDTPTHTDGVEILSMRIPFKSVQVQRLYNGLTPTVFSTHTITQNPNNGIDLADGIGISRWHMPDFSNDANGKWDDSVFIVATDSGVTQKLTDGSSNPLKPNVPLTVVSFWLPGTGATSTHVAMAIRHLVDICVNHPEQAPKEMF